ncbi:unnamed protein product [Boreogadus saida]
MQSQCPLKAPAGLLQFDQHQDTLNHKEHNNPDTPPARGSSPDLIAQRGFTMTAQPHSSTVKLDLGRIQSSRASLCALQKFQRVSHICV